MPQPPHFLSFWVSAPHRTRTCERAFIFGSSMQLSPTHGAPLFLIHFRAPGQSRSPPRHMMVPPAAAGGGGCRMERGGGIQPRAVASFSQRGGNKQHTHTHERTKEPLLLLLLLLLLRSIYGSGFRLPHFPFSLLLFKSLSTLYSTCMHEYELERPTHYFAPDQLILQHCTAFYTQGQQENFLCFH